MRAVPVPIPRRGESDLRPVVSAAPSRPNSRQAGVSLRLLARANQPKPAKPINRHRPGRSFGGCGELSWGNKRDSALNRRQGLLA